MKYIKHLTLSFVALASLSCSHSPGLFEPHASSLYTSVKCARYQSEELLHYCFAQPANMVDRKTISAYYVFYENGKDSAAFFTEGLGAEMAAAFQATPQETPVFISISFGPYWMLGSGEENLAGRRHRTLMKFMEEVEPQLAHVDRRVLVGTYSGGFNALSLFLRYPEGFHSAAVACPLLFPFNPFSVTREQMGQYAIVSGANPERSQEIVELMRREAGLELGEWQELDPLLLAKNGDSQRGEKVYLSVPEKEELGLGYSTRVLADLLRSKGLNVDLQIIEGQGRCYMDPRAMARFLAEEKTEAMIFGPKSSVGGGPK